MTLLSLVLALVLASAQESPNPARVDYVLDATPHAAGNVRVTMTVQGLSLKEARVAIPAWAPGAYRLAPYAKRISTLTASSGETNLAVSTVDPQTWKIATAGASPFTISYTVSAPESPRGGITKEHCDLQGPATYLYLADHKDLPCQLQFRLPEGWKAATGLDRKGDVYSARDYDTFIDCPAELGPFEPHVFELQDKRYEIVVHAPGPYAQEDLIRVCREVAREQTAFFGDAPFSRYVFLIHLRKDYNSNGLEHLNSTTLAFPYDPLRKSADPIASLVSHEFFHLWNVKRIRPDVLGPFDYTQPVRTRALWMCEGVTSYYGDLLLARSGLWSTDRLLQSIENEIETLQNNPDRLITSAEAASWTIWDARAEPRLSYYNKGFLLGLLLDLDLRRRTENRTSFDDVLRHLYDTHVRKGNGPIGTGYDDIEPERTISALSGFDFSDFFRKYVSGTEELPYAEYLVTIGIDAQIRARRTPTLGVSLAGTRVAGSPPATSPLRKGDRILRIDGNEVSPGDIRKIIQALTPEDEIPITVEREGQRQDLMLPVQFNERTTCDLRWVEEPDERQKSIRQSWLQPSKRDGPSHP